MEFLILKMNFFRLTIRVNDGSLELLLSKLRSASGDVALGLGDVGVDSIPDGIFLFLFALDR